MVVCVHYRKNYGFMHDLYKTISPTSPTFTDRFSVQNVGRGWGRVDFNVDRI